MSAEFDDFTFEQDLHLYLNKDSVVRPSVTQTLKEAGCIDYSMVDPDLLEAKRILGQNVHEWTAHHDKTGDADPMTLTARELGYAGSWMNFKRDFRPQFLEVETPMLRAIAGMEVGGTPDCIAFMNRQVYIIDKKCCVSAMPAWELQLADYEMLKTGSPRLGVYRRMSVRLGPYGKYHPTIYDDPRAALFAIAAVQLTYEPTNEGARRLIDTWKHNRRVRC